MTPIMSILGPAPGLFWELGQLGGCPRTSGLGSAQEGCWGGGRLSRELSCGLSLELPGRGSQEPRKGLASESGRIHRRRIGGEVASS